MKPDKISIKWKLFAYLAVFVAVMLILLWFFQIVFIDTFYKAIKTQTIKSYASVIEKNINNNELDMLIDRITAENDINIRIIDESGVTLYTSGSAPYNSTDEMQKNNLIRRYNKALKNSGTYLEIKPMANGPGRQYNENHFEGNAPPPVGLKSQHLIYSKIISDNAGRSMLVMLSSVITPVGTTVDTLKIQFFYIALILLIFSVVLAWLMSRRISKPIIKINESAKALAKGNYNITFSGKGYREISELSETLNYATAELSKVEKLRRELIANISHDLRTPLTMITGYGEVIRDVPGENTNDNIQIIIDEANRLTSLVNDILDISKIHSGTQELVLSCFNLKKSISDILKRYEKLISKKGYRIKFLSDRDVYVFADKNKILQVIYNLINNAITYTGTEKQVTVRQSISEGVVKTEFIDTGKGISPENIPLIWDRYYKVDKSHKRAQVGTGLGLSIVKAILDMHGANYGVISSNGQGSNFWFELNEHRL